MSLRLATTILCVSLITGCVIDDVNNAQHLYKQGEKEQAQLALSRLADEGYFEAKLALARLYSDPNEASYDPEKAIELYRSLSDIYPNIDQALLRLEMANASDEDLHVQHQRLWEHQRINNNALPLLVSFYRSNYLIFDANDLVPEITSLIENDETRLALRYTTRLGNVSQLYPPLLEFCEREQSTNAENCAKLALLQAMHTNDTQLLSEFLGDLNTQYQSKELGADQIASIASISKHRRYGEPNYPLYISIANIVGTSHPTLWYDAARVEYNSIQNDSNRINQLILEANTLAENHFLPAYIFLGNVYKNGKGVPQNNELAVQYWKQAQAIPEVQRLIGEMYVSGALGNDKLQEGVDWLLKAARNDEHLAYLELANVFKNGNGIIPNEKYTIVFSALYAEFSEIVENHSTYTITPELKTLINAERAARNAALSGVKKDMTP
ncbi:hypothetical protein L4C38_20095 [Vibrio kasasachensis]|uniref:SEL1-like repeat protein n=1 Tax=Vibrio kasasachensis TaxID=2910248 RepID=UPI003D0CAB2E